MPKKVTLCNGKKSQCPLFHCLLYRPNKALLWHCCLPVNLADTCNTLSVRIGNGREELQFVSSRMHDALEIAQKKLNINESGCYLCCQVEELEHIWIITPLHIISNKFHMNKNTQTYCQDGFV